VNSVTKHRWITYCGRTGPVMQLADFTKNGVLATHSDCRSRVLRDAQVVGFLPVATRFDLGSTVFRRGELIHTLFPNCRCRKLNSGRIDDKITGRAAARTEGNQSIPVIAACGLYAFRD